MRTKRRQKANKARPVRKGPPYWKKPALLLSLSALGVTSCLPSLLQAKDFPDVDNASWYAPYVQSASEKGYITGTQAGLFYPQKALSRADWTTLLYRLEGSPETSQITAFSDVAAQAYYAKAISWAFANNIVQGYLDISGASFKPENSITRQDAAVILYRYISAKKPEIKEEQMDSQAQSYLNHFADGSQVSDYAKGALAWAYKHRILTGNQREGQSYIDAYAGCTRAHAAKFLMMLDSYLHPTANDSALHVQGRNLVDASGNLVQIQGISSHGLAWYPQYINEALFKELKENFHINTIRLALYTSEYGGYCSGGDQSALKALIQKGIAAARAAGLYTIIDWHILQDNNPLTHLNEAKEFFGWLSSAYKEADDILYEICNEPNGSTTWAEIKNYASQIIPLIRSHDSNAIIICGTPTWSQDVDLAAQDPLPYDNVLYALHFYAATHKEGLQAKLQTALNSNLPVIVSEFSLSEASGSGTLDTAWAQSWIDLLRANHIGYVAWSLSNKAESSALLSAGSQKTSGLTEADLSECGRWIQKAYSELDGLISPPENSDASPSPDSGSAENSTSPPASTPSDSGGSFNETSLPQEVQLEAGNLSLSLQKVESWKEGDKAAYLLRFNALNKSAAVQPINFSLQSDRPFSLSQFWNCQARKEGNTILVSGADYKAQLNPGESLNDIGLIVIFQ